MILNNGKILAEGASSLLTNKKLMESVSLDIPVLVKVFEGVDYSPRTITEAKKIINKKMEA
ncbi:hypothetical protein [Candidatus Syntrophocurvum alkaliphilum]|uniref:hypothetical protein n=1 Tax=Candidatus Syntrophocurvum alkaliphilum TaxID=2293317 RepID=UPI0012E1F27D|nr:hypothetical protein [Candidatus Syntrophocurvum alkaliphilum]